MVSRTGLRKATFSNEIRTAYSTNVGNSPVEVNVQVTADQGLSAIHKQAKADIDDYYNNKSTNGVLNNPSDATGLAKALTKYALSAKSTDYEANLKELIPGTSTKYKDFGNPNGIRFEDNITYYGNEKARWSTENTPLTTTNANNRLSNIQAVQKEFK